MDGMWSGEDAEGPECLVRLCVLPSEARCQVELKRRYGLLWVRALCCGCLGS